MKQHYLNIIQGTDSCCILLYGAIGEYDGLSASDFVTQLLEAEAAHKAVDVHVNSVGGDVYAGIAILNALRQYAGDVTIYIDCIAASIASMIAVGCGKSIKMSRYARVMIHGVHGYISGNKQDLEKCIEEINRLDDILCEAYAKRTGLSPDEIRAKYFDGEEHWLNADEALALGFIDEIYDDETAPHFPDSFSNSQRCDEYTNIYINKLNVQLKNRKMFDKIKTMPGFTDCADEAAIMQRATEYKAKADKYDALAAENDQLKQEVADYKKKEEDTQSAADDAAVQQAIDEGRIQEAQRDTYKALMRSDRDNTTVVLASLPKKRSVMQDIHVGGGETDPWDAEFKKIDDNLKNK